MISRLDLDHEAEFGGQLDIKYQHFVDGFRTSFTSGNVADGEIEPDGGIMVERLFGYDKYTPKISKYEFPRLVYLTSYVVDEYALVLLFLYFLSFLEEQPRRGVNYALIKVDVRLI